MATAEEEILTRLWICDFRFDRSSFEEQITRFLFQLHLGAFRRHDQFRFQEENAVCSIAICNLVDPGSWGRFHSIDASVQRTLLMTDFCIEGVTTSAYLCYFV